MARQEPDIDEGQRLEVLERDECVRLLTYESFVGRLGADSTFWGSRAADRPAAS